MDTMDVIRQRRSIRKYKKEMPRDSDIEKMLEAGRWAPSGLNDSDLDIMAAITVGYPDEAVTEGERRELKKIIVKA